MNIWLDDQQDNPDSPERHVPEGWIGVKTALQACRHIRKGKVVKISFDHDLGDNAGSGYLVARYIEKQAFFCKIPQIQWQIHSANPVGRKNIEMAMNNADRLWKENVMLRT